MTPADIYLGAAVTVLVLFLVTAIVAYLVEVTRDAALGRAFRLHMGRNGAWKVLKTHQAMETEVARVSAVCQGCDGTGGRNGTCAGCGGTGQFQPREHKRNPAWMWHRRPELRIVQGGKAVRFEDDEGPKAA